MSAGEASRHVVCFPICFIGHLPKTYFPTSWLRSRGVPGLGNAIRDKQCGRLFLMDATFRARWSILNGSLRGRALTCEICCFGATSAVSSRCPRWWSSRACLCASRLANVLPRVCSLPARSRPGADEEQNILSPRKKCVAQTRRVYPRLDLNNIYEFWQNIA